MMHTQTRRGAMLLITILIMGSVALMIAIGLVLRGIGEMDMSFSSLRGYQTQALADGCVEHALLQIWEDSTYKEENYSLGKGKCKITIHPEGDTRRIRVDASIDKWKRTLEVVVDSQAIEMELLKWKQLPEAASI